MKIDNIHQKVLALVESGKHTVNQKLFNSNCGTQHCRAGLICLVAGLPENETWIWRAREILEASSDIWPMEGWSSSDLSNEDSLADIKRCAALEAKQ